MGEKFNAVKNYLFENILDVAVEHGKESAKEVVAETIANQVVETGANVLVDIGGSMVPGIGGAISSYRNTKRFKNVEITLEKLRLDHSELNRKFNEQTEENKQILDEIFDMVLDKASGFHQTEKIEYILHGYSKMLELENPSFDTAYLFFDVLDRLTLLDISVLQLSYASANVYFDGNRSHQTYEDILEKFDIDYSQYISIRENLYRIGLLEDDYDEKLAKDLSSLEKAVNEIRDVTESITVALSGKRNAKLKKLTNKSKVKFKAKERLKISKFGRQFIDFFLKKEE